MHYLIQWMNGIGVVWVFALMFLICADIIGRTLFDSPLQAVPEIVAFSLIACVFLQLAFATKMNRLTRVEFLVEKLKKNDSEIALSLERAFSMLGVGIMLAITIGAWPDFIRAMQTSEYVGVEGIYTLPITPIKLIVVIGSFVTALAFVFRLKSTNLAFSSFPRAWKKA
ncbi:MAG: TRAP transporter small permease, partial [Gammaproteobacteria bacterium]|nr:TRAP transporter small permease [Gammaproteobacteria bacterium]